MIEIFNRLANMIGCNPTNYKNVPIEMGCNPANLQRFAGSHPKSKMIIRLHAYRQHACDK